MFRVDALLPHCITFWDVVLGIIVNSVTLSLHMAKKMQHCAGFSACCCQVDSLPQPTPKHALAESIGWLESIQC